MKPKNDPVPHDSLNLDISVIPQIENGHVIHNPVAPGEEIAVECDLGYKLDCKTPVICVSANNTLPTKLPQCLGLYSFCDLGL